MEFELVTRAKARCAQGLMLEARCGPWRRVWGLSVSHSNFHHNPEKHPDACMPACLHHDHAGLITPQQSKQVASFDGANRAP